MAHNEKDVKALEKELSDLRERLRLLESSFLEGSTKTSDYDVLGCQGFMESLGDAAFLHPLMIEGYDNFITVNQVACDRLGYTREELLSLSPREISAQEDVTKHGRAEARKELDQGDRRIFRAAHIAKDGRRIPVEISSKVIRIADKKMILSLARDISDRIEMESALKQSEQRYRQISQMTSDYAYSFRIQKDQDLEIEWVTGALMTITGYQPEELNALGGWEKLILTEDSEVTFGQLKTLLSGKDSTVEYRVRTKNGSIRWMRDTAQPEIDPETGRIVRITGAVQDIHDQKEAYQKIAHSQQLLLSLSKAAEAVLQVTTQEEVLQKISDEIYKLGYANVVMLLNEEGTHLELNTISFDLNIVRKAENIANISAKSYRNEVREGGFFDQLLRDGTPLIDDPADEAIKEGLPRQLVPIAKKITKALGIERVIYVPLMINDHAIGLLSVIDPRLSEADLPAMTAFGNQAAIALENARLYREATQRMAWLDTLRKVDQAITSSLDLEFTLQILLTQLIDQLKVDAAAVLRYEEANQSLSYAYGKGFKTNFFTQAEFGLGEGFPGKVAWQRMNLYIPNINKSDTMLFVFPGFNQEDFVSYFGLPLIAKGKLVGVLEIYHREAINPTDEWVDFAQNLGSQAAIAIDNITLYNDLQRSNIRLIQAYDATIEGWAQALELRDMETEGHSRRVVDMTLNLARKLGVSKENLVHIRRGALLHDIGKMGIPDQILQKKGPLSDEEWETMRTHPVLAQKWLSKIEYLQPALDIPYAHHEKWDGTGYPRGLKEDQIPLAARIFAVIDSWDALLSDRPYRDAWKESRVIEHLKEQSGKQFDPRVVRAFLEMIKDN